MNTATYWIEKLQLEKHPEGGYFKETYRSDEHIATAALPERFEGNRCFATQIYYLLPSNEKSKFHRINQDETWHFYEGEPITIYCISPLGDFSTVTLGRGKEGYVFQYTVPKGFWFAASLESANEKNTGFSLVGCTVAPGFDFKDFELAETNTLIGEFPQHEALIQFLS